MACSAESAPSEPRLVAAVLPRDLAALELAVVVLYVLLDLLARVLDRACVEVVPRASRGWSSVRGGLGRCFSNFYQLQWNTEFLGGNLSDLRVETLTHFNATVGH